MPFCRFLTFPPTGKFCLPRTGEGAKKLSRRNCLLWQYFFMAEFDIQLSLPEKRNMCATISNYSTLKNFTQIKKSICQHFFSLHFFSWMFKKRWQDEGRRKKTLQIYLRPFTVFWFLLITIPQKKGLREEQKKHCNLPSYLKEQSLFIASWVILIYN